MTNEVRDFLKEKIRSESHRLYGVKDPKYLEQVTEQWYDDQNNYDQRWVRIRERLASPGKVLDMAGGCGTFLLYGLQQGYDVWGIEPEKWKREYFIKKNIASNYPPRFLSRLIPAVGEKLPFASEIFDLVTTYQTLEHVRDVRHCLQEMMRVLKPGGVLYLKAPDYNSFYEPHYRLFFFPKMNKKLAAVYLKIKGRPIEGLVHLHWITEKNILSDLQLSPYRLHIQRAGHQYHKEREIRIKNNYPWVSRFPFLLRYFHLAADVKEKVNSLGLGFREKSIDLWIEKIK